jgi:hypothetical protein
LDGVIIDEVYQRQHVRIEETILQNQARIDEMEEKRGKHTDLFESLVRLAGNLGVAYRKATPEIKMMFLDIFWERFEIQDKVITKAIPSKAVAALLNEKILKLKAKTKRHQVLISHVW